MVWKLNILSKKFDGFFLRGGGRGGNKIFQEYLGDFAKMVWKLNILLKKFEGFLFFLEGGRGVGFWRNPQNFNCGKMLGIYDQTFLPPPQATILL